MTALRKQKPLITPTPDNSDKAKRDDAREDKRIHRNQSEKEVDKTLEDSFPASDPPSH